MRIVLAYDASTGAQQAAALVGSIAWPVGSTLRVVRVTDPTPVLLSTAWAGGMASPAPELDAEVTASVESDMTDVADAVPTWRTGIGENVSQRIVDNYTRDLDREIGEHRRIAEEGAARLRLAGRKADADARAGDPAAEIIAAAAEWNADLVVLGSRGRTGLTRLLLGSVARNVVHGSVASVLIVRNEVQV